MERLFPGTGRPRGAVAVAVGIALACLGAAAVFRASEPPGERLETVDLPDRPDAGTSLCPWRHPQADLRAFFGPAATSYHTETWILTPFREEIIRRLGPKTPLRENALQVHRVVAQGDHREMGAVLVRRTAGRYGALEVVVGVRDDGRVAGVR